MPNIHDYVTAEQVRQYFEQCLEGKLSPNPSGECAACCPFHDDNRPSLSVNLHSGLWYCHACGSSGGDIFDFEMKLENCDFRTAVTNIAKLVENPELVQVMRAAPLAVYDYCDENGTLLFQVVRSRGKDFKQRRPDGKDGWIYKLDGVRRVLYNLPQVIAANTVCIAEGEKDADRLGHVLAANIDLEGRWAATTNPSGAGKWFDSYSPYLKGKDVIIFADNDEVGKRHAQQVAASVFPFANSTKVVELPGLPQHGDVSDYLIQQSPDSLCAEIRKAPLFTPTAAIHSAASKKEVPAERKLRFRTAKELASETPAEVEWLVRPWIAAGSITEVDGKIKKAGKTTWVTHLIRSQLDGTSFMGEPTTKSPVVYLTEQPDSSFREALKRAELLDRHDLYILSWKDTVGLLWWVVASEAVAECKRRGARLLVIDTMGQFTGLQGDSENNSGDALSAMKPLQEAAAAGIAVIVIRHERKSGGEVGDSGRGSTAFGGAVDTVLSIRRPEGNSRPTLRIIQGLSRFSEVQDELMIELIDGKYVSHGPPSQLAAVEARRAILAAVPDTSAGAVTWDALIETTGMKRTTAQEVVSTLLNEKRLVREGKGTKGDPHRFYAPKMLSAGTSSPIRQNESLGKEATIGNGPQFETGDKICPLDAPQEPESGTTTPIHLEATDVKTESLPSGTQDDYSADLEVEQYKEFLQMCEEHAAQLSAFRPQDKLATWGPDDFEQIVWDWPKHLMDPFIEGVCIACIDHDIMTRDAIVAQWNSMIGKHRNVLKEWQPYQVTGRIDNRIKYPGFSRQRRRRARRQNEVEHKWN